MEEKHNGGEKFNVKKKQTKVFGAHRMQGVSNFIDVALNQPNGQKRTFTFILSSITAVVSEVALSEKFISVLKPSFFCGGFRTFKIYGTLINNCADR